MSGRGRGRGRGGKRGGTGTSAEAQAQSAAPVKTALQQFLEGLLNQAYNTLPEAERPKADKKAKGVEEVDKAIKQILSVDPTEVHRLVVSLSLTLSIGGVLTSVNAKKVLGIVFSFALTELTRHWNEYGITKDQVHPSYHKYAESEGLLDCNQEDYNCWASTFAFLNNK
eukprot:TRINITY_DN16778_c0_g1_i1.p1 TRINITY_DN16778_c0_g1~~TRINITY_DN16778_c0_g1_i1.p1  ORF type:complete len:169 (-),score=35.99 TRINITY_DN16778_c0_g1_i1:64-570(-)